jgi:hypothetical protein
MTHVHYKIRKPNFHRKFPGEHVGFDASEAFWNRLPKVTKQTRGPWIPNPYAIFNPILSTFLTVAGKILDLTTEFKSSVRNAQDWLKVEENSLKYPEYDFIKVKSKRQKTWFYFTRERVDP